MNTTSNSDCCGGCGETDGNKRCIGCMHPFTTASAPEASKIAPGDDMWLSIHMAPFHLNYLTGDDRKEVLAYGRSVYQATRHVNDSLTDRKTNEIMEERGYQLTGYVLRHPETQHRAIIELSAVRWVQAADMAAIMYPQNRKPIELHDAGRDDGDINQVHDGSVFDSPAPPVITDRQMIVAAYTETGSPQGHAINKAFCYGAKWALSMVQQQPQHQPLTDERIISIRKDCYGGRFGVPGNGQWSDTLKFARAIEAEINKAEGGAE